MISHYTEKEIQLRLSKCEECMSLDCGYNSGALCHFPLVYGDKPPMTDEDGCLGYLLDNEVWR